MLFNSYEFIFAFFPLVVLVFFLVGKQHTRLAAAWLGLASLVFYGWWSVQALPLLLGSIAFNYLAGQRLVPRAGQAAPKAWLTLAVALNLGFLGLFKYADFFLGNVNVALTAAGQPAWPLLHWTLPIGISFYTFTQIAFLVDCWQGKVQETRFVHYLLFVTYFPHLVAGPVLHHAQMMPQFAHPATYRPDADKIALGLATFSFGLAKKLLLADPLGQYADLVFHQAASGTTPNLLAAWLGVIAYALQIYFDFSGYSDMAIGLSLCLGVRLPINFDSPYRATSIIDFWRRWHISLSTFLRDYLYVPLGGNRHGRLRRYLNLAATMLLGGLWHGASWNFVLWGALHGAYLTINHLWRDLRGHAAPPAAWPVRLTTGLLTFTAVCLAWVLFRAPDLAAAGHVYGGLFGQGGYSAKPFQDMDHPYGQARFYQLFLVGLLIATTLPNTGRLQRLVPALPLHRLGQRAQVALSALLASFLFAASVSRLGSHSAFLYFQF